MSNPPSTSYLPFKQDFPQLKQPSQFAAFRHEDSHLVGDFLVGSPLLYTRYECSFLPEGPPTYSTSSSSMTTVDATGLEIIPPSRIGLPAKSLKDPPQSYQWMCVPARMHANPTPSDVYLSSINNKKPSSRPELVPPPLADLASSPTSMAVLFNSDALYGGSPSQTLPSPPSVNSGTSQSPPRSIRFPDTEPYPQTVNTRVREKKHGCWMCHKSFDRPSTLRKHLLVHTGEKAFVCETCGRRFGVASNLNRHVRRCVLRRVNSAAPSQTNALESEDPKTAPTPPAPVQSSSQSPPSGSPTATTSIPAASNLGTDDSRFAIAPGKSKRTRPASTALSGSPNSSYTSSSDQTHSQPHSTSESKRPTVKRRRRAPSPTPWIPFSLLAFDLNPVEFHKSTPVPLPPVSPSATGRWTEERNSWDENVGLEPYSRDWTGKLPGPGLVMGPGLGKRDVGNLSGTGGYFMGRLSLF